MAARGLAEAGYGLAQGVANLVGDGEGVRKSREEMRQFYGEPEGKAGAVALVGGSFVGNSATFMIPGAAALRGAGALAKGGQAAQAAGRVLGTVANPLAGRAAAAKTGAAKAGLNIAGRTVGGTALNTPLNAAVSQSEEDSLAGGAATIAEALGKTGAAEKLREVARSPVKAFAAETAADLALGGVGEAVGEALGRFVRKVPVRREPITDPARLLGSGEFKPTELYDGPAGPAIPTGSGAPKALEAPAPQGLLPRQRGVPRVRELADEYANTAGIKLEDTLPRVEQVDPDFATRVAQWYDNAKSAPADPEVRAAYRAFADETAEQAKFLQDRGVRFEYVDENPYTTSADMLKDVAENNRLKVYKTAEGQGHPILSNEENDLFRAVHDYFGHAKEGHQFGPKGEENAFRVHSAMYSPLARRAMATETRGQNSWVNFGPPAAVNKAKPGSVYAEQKVLLMPEEFVGDYVGRAQGPAIPMRGEVPAELVNERLAAAAAARPYANVPDALMGFGRAGGQAFDKSRMTFELPVRVRWDDGDVHEDVVRGMNYEHALERARRNWEGAEIEPLAPLIEVPNVGAPRSTRRQNLNNAIIESGARQIEADAASARAFPTPDEEATQTLEAARLAGERAREAQRPSSGILYDFGGAAKAALRTQAGKQGALAGVGLVAAQSDDEKLRQTGYAIMGAAGLPSVYPAIVRGAKGGGRRLADVMAESPNGRKILDAISYDIAADPKLKELVKVAEEEMAKYRAIGQELAGRARALGPEADRALSDVLEGESFEATLDPKDAGLVAALAQRVADQVSGLGQEKVATGLISKATQQKRDRSYLQRMYAGIETEEAVADVPASVGGKKFRIEGERIRNDALTPEERNALGEIREASYRIAQTFGKGGKDIATARLFTGLSEIEGVVEPSYKVAFDEAVLAKGFADAARATGDKDVAADAYRQYLAAKGLADQISRQFKEKGGAYVRLPDTPALGVMRGAVVRKDVADYVNFMPDLKAPSMVWAKLLHGWKKIRTVYNLPTHVSNFISNVGKVHMAGLPLQQLVPLPKNVVKEFGIQNGDYLGRAARDIKQYGPATKFLAEKGILERGMPLYGDVAAKGLSNDKAALRQLATTTRPETLKRIEEAGLKPMSKAEQFARKADAKFTRAYAWEDGVFRVALFQKHLDNGMNPDDAAALVEKALPPYTTRSPALGFLKNTVSPFVLYPAKYIPSLLDDIAKHPERWVTLAAMWTGLDYASRKKYGPIDEKDLKPNERSSMFGYLMPGRTQVDAVARPLMDAIGFETKPGAKYTFDFSRWTPLSAISGSPIPGGLATQLGEDVPAILQPSGPVADLTAIALNRDAFTGDPLIRPQDVTGMDKAKRLLPKAGALVTPSALSFHLPRVLEDLRNDDPAQALLDATGFVGLRPQMVVPGMQQAREQRQYELGKQGVRSDLKYNLRKAKSEERREELRANARRALQALAEKRRSQLSK
jgi:hypothetical protein